MSSYIKLCPEMGGGRELRRVFSPVEAAREEGSGCGLITRLVLKAEQSGLLSL